MALQGRLWLRGRASALLSEGRWFDSPGLPVKVSLGKETQTAPRMAATAFTI